MKKAVLTLILITTSLLFIAWGFLVFATGKDLKDLNDVNLKKARKAKEKKRIDRQLDAETDELLSKIELSDNDKIENTSIQSKSAD